MYDITQRVNINLYSYTYNTYLRACMYIDAYETMIFLISRRERTLEIAMKSFLLFLFPLLFPSSARPPARPLVRLSARSLLYTSLLRAYLRVYVHVTDTRTCFSFVDLQRNVR